MPKVEVGELLAIPVAGAYQLDIEQLQRPRPAAFWLEVLVAVPEPRLPYLSHAACFAAWAGIEYNRRSFINNIRFISKRIDVSFAGARFAVEFFMLAHFQEQNN